ncbi:MAG TPA: DEAD/DEAH box helicase [Gemmatimonadaceae bacterium]
MIDFDVRSAADVRAAIAATILPPGQSPSSTIGSVTLHDRQRVAAERLCAIIRDHGGALLADPVGLGKTYTALAVATRLGGSATIVAPASLRTMWLEAIGACGVDARVVTHESLSRGATLSLASELVIVDEAHRFRSPATKRYATLANALHGAPLLLVSATPVQNRRADLVAQLALIVGRRAWSLSDGQLAAFVIRDGDTDGAITHIVPELNGPIPISLASDDDCLDYVLALPPPVAPRDESIALTLLTYGLVHQWSSSRAALVAALRRRRTQGLAVLAALDAGRYPTRGELSAWTHLDDALQLAFPELVASHSAPELERNDLAVTVDRHLAGIEALLNRCRATRDPDDERASLLARLMDVHRGERIIAFCHYIETVEALRRRLATHAGIATLTAHGARIASGRVSRATILAQFSPRNGARDVDASQRVDLLIATDLLSEGLNLQEASVVVHLDLPWNPARLDQRVGRARRMGSRHRVVTVYSFTPPTSAERMLRIQDRLREKLAIAQRAVGVAGRILPAAFAAAEPMAKARSLAERSSVIDRRLREWSTSSLGAFSRPTIAAVSSPFSGFVAAVSIAGVPHLIAEIGRGITDDPAALDLATSHALGRDIAAPMPTIASTLDHIVAYLASRRGADAIDFTAAASARGRRAALARVAQALARTPRHRRTLIAPLVDAARSIATAPLGEGAERVLDTLVQADLPDEAWLRSIATFGELNARQVKTSQRGAGARILAVVVLVRL